MTLSDHQETELFTYERSYEEIELMLDRAERKKNQHFTALHMCKREDKIYHMRQFKALEGVVKTLRWVLGDKKIDHPLE